MTDSCPFPMPVRKNGDTEYVLLAACADGEGGGGIYSFDGAAVERVDGLDTSGLTLAGDRLARLRWSEPGDATGLFVYDRWGIERYYRLNDLGDAHQVAWDGANFVLVSTGTNSIVWLAPSGDLREWKAPGEGDAWHLNGISIRGDNIFISAFGRFSTPKGWADHRKDGSGILFNLASGEDVLRGLNCPHNPCSWNGDWFICNAADHEVLQFDGATGAARRRVKLHGWTRGLVASDDFLFVGVSAPRHDPGSAGEKGSIAVIAKESWTVQAVLPVGSREVSDLAIVPRALAEGIHHGFSNKHIGTALFGAVPGLMMPLDAIAPGLIVLQPLEFPSRITAGEEFECKVRVENSSLFTLQSLSPAPIHLSYHWLDETGNKSVVFDGVRTPLPQPLFRKSNREYEVRIKGPDAPGIYRVRLTLVQEGVRWMDEPPTGALADLEIAVEQCE